MRLFNFKYPKLAGLLIAIFLAYFIFKNPAVSGFVSHLGNLSYFGVFIAGILFIALLSGMSVAIYSKELVGLAQKMLNDRKFLNKGWLPILIWLVLILWALKEILM